MTKKKYSLFIVTFVFFFIPIKTMLMKINDEKTKQIINLSNSDAKKSFYNKNCLEQMLYCVSCTNTKNVNWESDHENFALKTESLVGTSLTTIFCGAAIGFCIYSGPLSALPWFLISSFTGGITIRQGSTFIIKKAHEKYNY